MHFTCPKVELFRALKIAARGVKVRSPLPVTQFIRFRACFQGKNQPVTLYSTDTELAIHTSFIADVEQTGEVCLPAKRMSEIVTALSSDRSLTMKCSDSLGTSITSGKSTFRLAGMNASEIPSFPPCHDETGLVLPESLLHDLCARSVYASSKDDTRPVLTGVCWTVSGNVIELAATDVHILAISRLEFDGDLGRYLRVIVPREALLELLHLVHPDSDKDTTVWVDETQITFRLDNCWLMSRLIAGTYPDYGRFVPETVPTSAILLREPLLESMKRMEVVARESLFKVFCTFADGKLSMKATCEENEAEEELPSEHVGCDQSIILNTAQLTSILETFEGSEVFIGIDSSMRPIIVRPMESEDYYAIAMPMSP